MSYLSKLEFLDKAFLDAPVGNLQLSESEVLDINMTIREACQKMTDLNLGSLGVVENGEIYGTFSAILFLKRVISKGVDIDLPLGEIVKKSPVYVRTNSALKECLKQIGLKHSKIFPIVDENKRPVHNLLIWDILIHLSEVMKNSLKNIGEISKENFWDVLPEEDQKEILLLENQFDNSVLVAPLRRVVGSSAVCIENDISVYEGIKKMAERNSNCIVFTKYGTNIEGVFTERSVFFNFFSKTSSELKKLSLYDYLSPSPLLLLGDHLVGHALKKFATRQTRQIIMIDHDRYPVQVIDPVDVIRFMNYAFLS